MQRGQPLEEEYDNYLYHHHHPINNEDGEYHPEDEFPARPAPPIWLPPPPPLSSEENSRASSLSQRAMEEMDYSSENEDDDQHHHQNSLELDPNQLRWGRANFTQDEIHTLDIPLQTKTSQVFHSTSKNEMNKVQELTLCQKIVSIILIVVPALCFTTAAHFISGIMTDFKLFSASFSVFQGVFWPSFIFLLIDLIWGKRLLLTNDHISTMEESSSSSASSACLGLCCTNERWKLTLWLLFHSVLSSISIIAQLLSIQRLSISVSLALSFSSIIFVILLDYINREKKFSLELICFSILGYLSFIIVGIPAMKMTRWTNSEHLTAGVIASIISSATAVPATFILCKLRREKVFDSLIATSFALHGSMFSLFVKIFMESSILHFTGFDPISIGWAAGLTTLVIFGTVFTILEGRFRHQQSKLEDCSNNLGNSNLSRMRVLIFMFSCFWEIIRQGIWNTFPDMYDIIGSVLVFSAFLLSVGYEAWSLRMSEEVKRYSAPFQFIPWLFSRSKTSNLRK